MRQKKTIHIKSGIFSIYKYFRFNDNFKSTLLDKKLWFSNFLELNDPFEFHSKFTDDKEQLDIAAKDFIDMVSNFDGYKDNPMALEGFKLMLADYPDFLYLLLDFSSKSISKNIGICCFSIIPNDTLMWAHYADSHTGVVVEFDFIKLYKSLESLNDKNSFEFDFVNYVKTFPKQKIGEIKKSELRSELKKRLWTKLAKWKYEDEWRVLSINKGGQCFDTTSITSIIKGHRISPASSEELQAVLDKVHLSDDFKLKNISLDNETGELTII